MICFVYGNALYVDVHIVPSHFLLMAGHNMSTKELSLSLNTWHKVVHYCAITLKIEVS